MTKFLLCLFFYFLLNDTKAQLPLKTKNIIVVTIDGIRWQEIFKGADVGIISDKRYTQNEDLLKLMYIDSSCVVSRRKLLPFFWNVIEQKGRLYGNRNFGNKVNVSNVYKFSYPGYNELLTGYPDLYVSSNKPVDNVNINVLEYLNSFDAFNHKVVAFTSWNIFSYIFNKSRSDFPIYSGYDTIGEDNNVDLQIFNKAQQNLIGEKTGTTLDALTFLAATEYIKVNKPKIIFIGFGECDEDAHKGNYDSYLTHLSEADKMIQQLWYFIQSTPGYKDETTLIITTDHGRGKRKWTDHDLLVKGSGDAWLAVISPDIEAGGEIQLSQEIYQKQLASTIAKLVGYHFIANHPVANPVNFKNTR